MSGAKCFSFRVLRLQNICKLWRAEIAKKQDAVHENSEEILVEQNSEQRSEHLRADLGCPDFRPNNFFTRGNGGNKMAKSSASDNSDETDKMAMDWKSIEDTTVIDHQASDWMEPTRKRQLT